MHVPAATRAADRLTVASAALGMTHRKRLEAALVGAAAAGSSFMVYIGPATRFSPIFCRARDPTFSCTRANHRSIPYFVVLPI